MKINPNQLNIFLNNIPENIKSILIYGYDNGLIYDRSKVLQTLLQKKHGNINISKFTYDDIKNQKIDLYSSSQNFSFFSNFKLYIIEDIPAKIDKTLEEAILKLPKDSFVIFLAKELPPSASVRKLFEQEENLAIIPCYQDDSKTIRKIALAMLSKENKQASEEVLSFLEKHLIGDRKNIINEINKIIVYAKNKEKITIEDALLCCNMALDLSIDNLCFAISDKNFNLSIQNFYNLLEKDIPVISLMRSVLNYFVRLYYVKNITEKGINPRIAMKELSPPIFIFHQEIFFKHLQKFKLNELEEILYKLNKLESMSKKTGSPSLALSENFIQNLCLN